MSSFWMTVSSPSKAWKRLYDTRVSEIDESKVQITATFSRDTGTNGQVSQCDGKPRLLFTQSRRQQYQAYVPMLTQISLDNPEFRSVSTLV